MVDYECFWVEVSECVVDGFTADVTCCACGFDAGPVLVALGSAAVVLAHRLPQRDASRALHWVVDQAENTESQRMVWYVADAYACELLHALDDAGSTLAGHDVPHAMILLPARWVMDNIERRTQLSCVVVESQQSVCVVHVVLRVEPGSQLLVDRVLVALRELGLQLCGRDSAGPDAVNW